jgi:hypothetical protein
VRRISALALALSLPLALAGCGSAQSGNTNYSQFLQIARQSLDASFGKIRVTRDQAASIPYASMGFMQDGGNESIVILGTDSGGEQLWTSSAKVVIVTRDGRITRTLGLDHDIAGMTARGGVMPAPAAAITAPFTSTRLQDYPEMDMYGVIVSCSARAVARQTIKILGQPIATMRVDESCRARKPEWRFTDTFWVDTDNGRVWRARQHIHPKGGMIETEIFRPPG